MRKIKDVIQNKGVLYWMHYRMEEIRTVAVLVNCLVTIINLCLLATMMFI